MQLGDRGSAEGLGRFRGTTQHTVHHTTALSLPPLILLAVPWSCSAVAYRR